MAETEEGLGGKEEAGQDMGRGGSMLGRPPMPGSQDTGASDQRGDGTDAPEALEQGGGPDLVD